jgi:putative flippase GtrA
VTAWAALLGQFARFALVGVFCTAIQVLVLVMGVEGLGLDAVLASSLGYLLSAVASYLLNRRFTYASSASHAVLAWRFVTVLAIGVVLNALFMQLLHGYLQWQYVLAQLFATGGTLLWNFCAHRYWTFSRS